MENIEQSPYIEWINHLDRHQGHTSFPHPPGDYFELNRYIQRTNKLIATHCPNQKIQFFLEPHYKTRQPVLTIINSFTNTSFQFDVEAAFFNDITIHQNLFIASFQKILANAENTYNHHPFKHDGKIQFSSALFENQYKSEVSHLFIPFGEFKNTSKQINHIFKQVQFFLPAAELTIFYHQLPYCNKYSVEARFEEPTDIYGSSQTLAAGNHISFHFDHKNDFINHPEEVDQAIFLALESLMSKVEQLEAFKKSQAKVDLYHKLDENLNQLDDYHTTRISPNSKIKI